MVLAEGLPGALYFTYSSQKDTLGLLLAAFKIEREFHLATASPQEPNPQVLFSQDDIDFTLGAFGAAMFVETSACTGVSGRAAAVGGWYFQRNKRSSCATKFADCEHWRSHGRRSEIADVHSRYPMRRSLSCHGGSRALPV